MNSGKGNQAKPQVAGVDYVDYTTNETNLPHTYFAGTRKLPISWVMTPIIAFAQPANNSGKGNK